MDFSDLIPGGDTTQTAQPEGGLSFDDLIPKEQTPSPAQSSLLQRMGELARTPSPAWMQPFETAVKANVQPFIEHPFRSAYEMIVPQPSDIEAFKPSNLARTTPVGSQEWLNQAVGYGLPLLGMGASEAFPRARVPFEAELAMPRPAPVAPVAASEPLSAAVARVLTPEEEMARYGGQQRVPEESSSGLSPEARPAWNIRGEAIRQGDQVKWMSGGTWDGVVQDATQNPSGTHDVTVKASNGDIFTLKDAEHYGISKGASQHITGANRPEYPGWEQDYPQLVQPTEGQPNAIPATESKVVFDPYDPQKTSVERDQSWQKWWQDNVKGEQTVDNNGVGSLNLGESADLDSMGNYKGKSEKFQPVFRTEDGTLVRTAEKPNGDLFIERVDPKDSRLTLNEPTTGESNAVQEPQTGEILQRQPQETGVPGGERGRVEPSQQGVEPALPVAGEPVPEQAAPEAPVSAGTSNRVFKEAYGEGEVPSGTGVDTEELLDNARTDVASGRVDPYEVLSRTRANNYFATDPEYAALAVEHERLVNEAVRLQKAGDPASVEAAKAANDFANAIQPYKTKASDRMRQFQGDLNYDFSTPFGIDQYMRNELGRGMKESEVPKFGQMSNGIRAAENEVPQAVARADAKVRNHYARVRDIPMEEAASRVRQMLADCVV